MFKQNVSNTKTTLAKLDIYFFKQLTGTNPSDIPIDLVNFSKLQDIDSSPYSFCA